MSVRRVVCVGGGRGGVGKSVLAQNLAIYLAQLGRAVALVDADPTGANLHAHFGLAASTQEPSLDPQSDEMRAMLVQTSVPGLALLPAAHDAPEPRLAPRGSRKARWLAQLRALPVEFLVVDVGPGHGQFALDVMATSDIPIAVTTPEPAAVETTYRFVRASYRRRLRRSLASDRFRLAMVDRVYAELGGLPAPPLVVRALARLDRSTAAYAWGQARLCRAYLVVNQTRVRSDVDLGADMGALARRHLGVELQELGHVEHDDNVWLAVRRGRALLVDSPASRAGRNLERIARRVLALVTTQENRPPPEALPLEQDTLYQVLGVERSASDEDIRRSYKHQREVYARGSLAIQSLVDDAQLRAHQARIDEAYDTLLDPVRRRAYDLSSFPDDQPAPPKPASRSPLAAEQLMLQQELAREIGPDTQFTGELLRKVRESQGIEVAEISAKTKISRAHLEAIEGEDFTALPAPVYVRGFVSELAKCLRLDPAIVQKTYVRRMRDALAALGRDA